MRYKAGLSPNIWTRNKRKMRFARLLEGRVLEVASSHLMLYQRQAGEARNDVVKAGARIIRRWEGASYSGPTNDKEASRPGAYNSLAKKLGAKARETDSIQSFEEHQRMRYQELSLHGQNGKTIEY